MNTLPAAQTLHGHYVSAFNFPPTDFSFYQRNTQDSEVWEPRERPLRGAVMFFGKGAPNVAASGMRLRRESSSTSDLHMTVEFWIKVDRLCDTTAEIISLKANMRKGETEFESSKEILRLRRPDSLNLVLNNQKEWKTSINLLDDDWHHIAVTVTDDGVTRLFLDARERGTATGIDFRGADNLELTLHIGNVPLVNTGPFRGMVGHLRIWNVARSADELKATAGVNLDASAGNTLQVCFGDRFDPQSRQIADSTGAEKPKCKLGESEADVRWDETVAFGLIEKHLHPITSMTGFLVLDARRQQQVYSQQVAVSGPYSAITVALWVKVPISAGKNEVVFSLECGSTRLTLRRPHDLRLEVRTDPAGEPEKYRPSDQVVSIADGRWHHVAVVFDTSRATDGALMFIDAESVMQQPPKVAGITGDLCLRVGALDASQSSPVEAGPKDVGILPSDNKYLSASVSDIRLYKLARTEKQILNEDASFRPASHVHGMVLYWPLSKRPAHGAVADESGNRNSGLVANPPVDWSRRETFGRMTFVPETAPSSAVRSPTASHAVVSTAALPLGEGMLLGPIPGSPPLAQTHAEEAFARAKASGYFDPLVFPNIFGLRDEDDHVAARNTIANLDSDTFIAHWKADRRLSLKHHRSGRWSYEFVPVPRRGFGPMLFLIEDHAISSYFGDLGQGQVVCTFSLTPGESSFASIKSYKETDASAQKASSVVDSITEQSVDSYESSLGENKDDKTEGELSLDLLASAGVKARWGFGNANASTELGAKGNVARSSFLQRTSNALKKHASEASAARNVEVNTTFAVQTKQGRETSITREFKNINNARTLNIVFRQLSQSIKVAQLLTDVRVGYIDPNPGSFRAVPLSQLDDLLETVLAKPSQTKLQYKSAIINEVRGIATLCKAASKPTFLVARDMKTGRTREVSDSSKIEEGLAYMINPELSTDLPVTEKTTVAVEGLLMATHLIVMRTDNVVADVEIGMGVGLDTYAEGLQVQTVRREKTNTDTIEAENRKIAAAVDILEEAKASGMPVADRAKLYRELFPINPAGGVSATLYQGVTPTPAQKT